MRAFFVDAPAEDSFLLDYALSKCTEVYTSATYLRVAGGAAPVFSNGVYVGSGESSTAIRIGMRTKF
jgi:predicted porin